MASIEIDFDVYKALTLRRETESMTYNDVLRRLLDLEAPEESLHDPGGEKSTSHSGEGCVMQGIHFPDGTEFRVTYKGRTYTARINNGQWVDEQGHVRRSPSDAATAITRNNVNGWRFWWFKRPGDGSWRKLRELQK